MEEEKSSTTIIGIIIGIIIIIIIIIGNIIIIGIIVGIIIIIGNIIIIIIIIISSITSGITITRAVKVVLRCSPNKGTLARPAPGFEPWGCPHSERPFIWFDCLVCLGS